MCGLRAFDLVECIDDTPVLKTSRTMPGLGQHYRIESIKRVGNGYSVRLMELKPDCHLGGTCLCGHCGWDSSRFRLVRRLGEYRLATFHEMLDDAGPQPERPKEPVN